MVKYIALWYMDGCIVVVGVDDSEGSLVKVGSFSLAFIPHCLS